MNESDWHFHVWYIEQRSPTAPKSHTDGNIYDDEDWAWEEAMKLADEFTFVTVIECCEPCDMNEDEHER